jgi:hypothetical protein
MASGHSDIVHATIETQALTTIYNEVMAFVFRQAKRFAASSLAILSFFGSAARLAAQSEWSFELMSGCALNLPSPLVVRQAGYPDIRLTARYSTRPFSLHAPYYSWRIGRWKGKGWELEHLHHKLFLTNRPPEIQEFAISHGYNYLFLGRAWERGNLAYRFGLGPIITHPEATVRGRTLDAESGGLFDAGYYLSGLGVRAAAGRKLPLSRNVFVAVEAGFVAGWTWDVPMPGGAADVPNLSLHGRLGVGLRL